MDDALASLPPETLVSMLNAARRERDMWREHCLDAEKTAGKALGLLDKSRTTLSRQYEDFDEKREVLSQIYRDFPHFAERALP